MKFRSELIAIWFIDSRDMIAAGTYELLAIKFAAEGGFRHPVRLKQEIGHSVGAQPTFIPRRLRGSRRGATGRARAGQC